MSQFFGYDGSYHNTDTIQPGRGYWVKSSLAGKLILGSSHSISPANRIRIEDGGEFPPPPPTQDGKLEMMTQVPSTLALAQNYPNPFNPRTEIRYVLPSQAHVSLKVIDLLGREVAVLADEVQQAGKKSVEFDAGSLPSGIYFYRLIAGSFIDTKKLMILR